MGSAKTEMAATMVPEGIAAAHVDLRAYLAATKSEAKRLSNLRIAK